MRYRKREGEESGPGRVPIERTHGKIVVCAFPNSKLLFEVIKRIELVASIEVFVIFPVAPFNLAIVPRRIRLNELVPDAEFL